MSEKNESLLFDDGVTRIVALDKMDGSWRVDVVGLGSGEIESLEASYVVSSELISKMVVVMRDSSKKLVRLNLDANVLESYYCQVVGGWRCRFLVNEFNGSGRAIYYCLGFELDLVKDGTGNCVKCMRCRESEVVR